MKGKTQKRIWSKHYTHRPHSEKFKEKKEKKKHWKQKAKWEIEPAIPLLGMNPKEVKADSQTDTCTPVLLAAWFTIAKLWKQRSVHGRLHGWRTVVCTHNRILFSLKKEGHSDTGHNMDEPWGHHAKWNKPDAKVHMWFLRSLKQSKPETKVEWWVLGEGE